ncbi:DNA polymerase I, partial [Microgenomates group bacterium]|nr:DNA polymerase I [Microgenomates group bacterium]
MLFNQQPILLIVDAFALIYRSFYAFPETITNKEGQSMNAAYGFMRTLLDAFRKFSPQYAIVAFDSPTQTIRQQLFSYYKSTRPPMPESLHPQLQPIKDFIATLDIPQFSINGQEADDIIGTLVCRTKHLHPHLLSIILTG